jgi:hypothetical protein
MYLAWMHGFLPIMWNLFLGAEAALFHYTSNKGYKAISSQHVWLFKAFKPPGDRPKGAYFTTLAPGTPNLAKRLFVRGGGEKTKFVFSFSDVGDLKPLEGGRGQFIFCSENDYPVEQNRQRQHGPTAEFGEQIQ